MRILMYNIAADLYCINLRHEMQTKREVNTFKITQIHLDVFKCESGQ